MSEIRPRQRLASAPDSLVRLEQALPIDQHDLEGERRTQHDKFYSVSSQLALTISRRDAAKKHAKEIEAQLAEDIRGGWDQEANGRLTDTACAAKVLLHPDMIDATEELLAAEAAVGRWFALKDAYEQRNTALEGLIRLHLSQYYGEARLDRASHSLRDAEAEANRAAIARMRDSAPPPRRR
jgi:hypothetical protein